MTATNHGLTGAAIGLTLHNYPLVALPLAFASHFVLDALPHFGFDDLGGHLKIRKRLFYDVLTLDAVLLTTSLTFLIGGQASLLALACWFLAGSPDIIWAYRYVIKEKRGRVKPGPMNAFNRFHSKIQWSQTIKGTLIEVPVMVALFVFVYTKLW